MTIARLFAFAAAAGALCLGCPQTARAGQVLGSLSYGTPAATIWTPDVRAAAAYCKSTGGAVQVRTPEYGTNGSSGSQLVLAGTAGFCAYTAKNGSSIFLLLSTLYATQPSLAALAYYAKVQISSNCLSGGANPASCYCTQLGGSDQFGGTGLAGGAWVLPGNAIEDLEACIFPDLSSVDSWGLTYHSRGIIRGIDLSKVLRYHHKH